MHSRHRGDSPSLRTRLASGDALLGTFIKTPSPHVIEVIGDVGFDFVVVDEEHAPFDRSAIDLAVLAAKACGIRCLVRVSSTDAILSAADMGACGVMVPHIRNAEAARRAVAASRYQSGSRGFTNSSRAGNYGRKTMREHVEFADAHTAVIAMIEDAEAVESIEEIAAVPGIDAFFLGRGDLTVALGELDTHCMPVRQAVERIALAVRNAGKPLCAFISSLDEVTSLKAVGVSAFIFSSDQGLLRQAAALAQQRFAASATQQATAALSSSLSQ